MTQHVYPLPAPSQVTVGGKAANLGRLMALGYPVPAAVAVIAESFRKQLERPAIRESLETALEPSPGRAERLAALRNRIRTVPLDPALCAELESIEGLLGPAPWAVRSSAVGEDSSAHSFAGQYDTVLGVCGIEALKAAIHQCWASAFSDRAVEYRERCGIDLRSIAMAVVIQPMVAADTAGVLFTCDPVTGRTDRLILEAVAGLGESLVSGRAEPDRWIIERTPLRILERIRAQDLHRQQPLLTDVAVLEVARTALAVAESFGAPQDIEFAFEGGQLRLLQTRPVTTSIRAPTPEDRMVWSNSNLGELAPDVATPMTFWVVQRFALGLMRPIFTRLGFDVSNLTLLGQVAGRIYLNMNTTVALMRSLPGMKKKGFADFFGGDLTELGPALAALQESDLPPVAAHPWKTLVRVPLLAMWLLRHAGMNVPRLMSALEADTARLTACDPIQATDPALLHRINHSIELQEQQVAAGFACVSSAQWLTALCRRWLGDEDGSISNRLLSGLGGIDSAEAGLALWRLAITAQEVQIREVILSGSSWNSVRAELNGSSEGARFLEQWDAFMDRHGHHTRAEIDVAVPRWREEPDYVLGLLRGYLATPMDRNPLELHDRCRREREALLEECRRRLGPLRRRVWNWLYRRAQQGMVLREGAKSDLIRRVALLRRDLLEVGRRLVDRGVFDQATDVFFLTHEELSAALGVTSGINQRTQVAARRAEHARYSRLTPPAVVVGTFDPLRQRLPANKADRVLRGVPVSPGIAEGPARIILRADAETQVLPGEILVAPFTDPGWTPYFLTAAAIVMDQGGLLSHGSVVARELGVPAVVNVGPATQVLKTGQRLRVDAFRGEITVLQEEPPC